MNEDTSTLTIEGATPFAQIPRWILRSGDHLSHGAVRLYGVIMTYADNTSRTAFPARERLGEDLGVSVRSIGKYVKELEEFGALKVTRRRNKRNGNFYANHYVLVFDPPQEAQFPRREEAGFPITTPTEVTTPTTVTRPSQAMSPNVARSILTDPPLPLESDTSSAGRTDAADAADPVGPEWRRSPKRAEMIQAVRTYAQHYHSFDNTQVDNDEEWERWTERKEEIESQIDTTLEEALGTEMHIFSSAAYDQGWTPPKRVITSNFEAGIWLNKFLHWIQGDHAYAGQTLTYTSKESK